MELFKASRQWSERPADERFWTVADLHAAVTRYRDESVTKTVPYVDIRAGAVDAEVVVLGKAGVPAKLTHWAFGQLAARAEAPANYLRALPAPLAVQCLNHGLAERTEGSAQLLMHPNGTLVCRAMTSERYTRIWNSDITKRMLVLAGQGWRVPPARPYPGLVADGTNVRPATEEDLLQAGQHGLSIRLGDPIAPAGLYASDHDMFVFLVNEDRVINAGQGESLNRGFFAWNSEVGAASFSVMTFLYESVCGNHIVWGAKGVRELRVRHIGNADERAFRGLAGELKAYADESVSDTEAKIRAAKSFILGTDKEAVLDRIFGLRTLSLKAITAGYEMAVQYEHIHGAPNTAWGMVSGLTRVSQATTHMDTRVALDRAAGKIMDLVF